VNPYFQRVARLLALCLLASSPITRGALDGFEASALFKEGRELFEQANAIATSDPERARDLYLEAAMHFERLVRDGAARNGRIYYNIGNAYFRAGDLGRAILNYRRAEQFIPNDTNLQQNLAFARSRRKDKLEETPEARVSRTLFFWHYDLSFTQRFRLFVAAFAALWGAAALRLFMPRPFLRWVLGVAALLALAMAASLITESLDLENERPGVVLAGEVVARKGDSQTYAAAFKDPLHSGTEFLLLEQRRKWAHVQLPDGRRCWLPANSIAMVRQSP